MVVRDQGLTAGRGKNDCELAHPGQRLHGLLQSTFQGRRFESVTSSKLIVRHEIRSVPLKRHLEQLADFNSRLRDYFDDECRRLVSASASGQSIVDQVRKRLIHAMDGGDTSIEAIAKQLGLSGRSLQRRLAEEGTRYNDVLGSVREEFAKRYLARGTVSASEVAYLLGFTEPPAFFKAFKRWTGMTPREFQLEALGGAV